MKRFYPSKLIILIALLCGWNLSANAQSSTFNWNGTAPGQGSVQTYTVPLGVTQLGIDAKGGAGGSPYIYSTCTALPTTLAGRVQCVLTVTGGEVLYIYVGSAGQNDASFAYTTGGFNGGGNGYYFGAASGGATDIRLVAGTVGSTVPYQVTPYTSTGTGYSNNRIIVAGGGGAGGDYSMPGGIGGGLTGGTASSVGCAFYSGTAGSGGGSSGPGPTGTVLGALGVGGSNYTGGVYGPGGGGYWGGNSGVGEGGGGGGSSYTDPILVTAVTHTQGYSGANGNGQVIITVLCNGAGTITGTASACAGFTTTLTAVAAAGGTWSSSNPSIATIGSTGVVTGVSPGNSTITYNVPNPCGGITPASVTVTINQTPTAITGTPAVCTFSTTNLSSTPSPGGTWTSSNNGLATVDPVLGIVNGVTVGVPVISYTLANGCFATTPVTVNSGPAAIIGTPVVCAGGGTSNLSDISTGGTWSTAIPSFATISATGVLTGVSAGLTPVSYTFISTGCSSTVLATVNALPTPFSVFQSGGNAYCAGSTSTIVIALSGSATGIKYQLFDGATAVGAPLTGTGLPLNFGVMSAAGTYTVVDTNATTKCYINASGTGSISITPLPVLQTLSAPNGNSYCASGSGVTLQLSGSQPLYSYKLFNGGATPVITVTGTGSAITFPGLWPAGSYSVVASDATANHCSSTMTGSPLTVISNPLPTPNNVTVTNGGAYCNGTSGVHVGLDFSNTGIVYSLYRGGIFVDSVAGSNSGLDFGLQTTPGTYTVIGTNAASRCFNSMTGSATVSINYPPTPVTLSGGGSYCPGGTGVPVGISASDNGAIYQLYNGLTPVGSTVIGTGSGFNFGTFTTSGTYTVTGLNPTTGCKDTMPGSVSITASSLPTLYTVMGGGGFCSGGGGRDISLSNSDAGTTYQLNTSGGTVSSMTSLDGGSLDFGNFTTAGTYTVVASNGSCSSNMLGSATIIVNPVPNVYIVTGSGGYCVGTGGRHVGLSFSDVGINYQLYNGGGAVGSAMAGSGSGLDFGSLGSGNYTVIGVNPVTGCSSSMSGAAFVNINLLPATYNVTGGGDFCAGTGGKDIGLDGSDNGVNYQLYRGTTPIGSPVPGGAEGGSIDFGFDSVAGTYTVVATNTGTTCTNNMSGNAVIIVDPLPHVFMLTGGGNFCTGGLGRDIMLSGSNTGINYQLFNSGLPVSPITNGTGSVIDFGPEPGTGGYTAIATDAVTNCSSTMAGTPVVSVIPLPNLYTVTGGGDYCAGGTGKPVGLSGSDAGIHYQLFVDGVSAGGTAPGSGIALNFGLRTLTGTYIVIATNPATTCTDTMNGNALISADPLPVAHTVAGSGAYCAGTAGVDLTLSPSDESINYLLYRGGVLIDSAAGGSAVLDFGMRTAGVYTIVGVDMVHRCAQNMTGSAVITVNTVNVYSVIGGGSYCQGGAGVHIGQSGSSSLIHYQLMQGGLDVGGSVTGTGGALDFGLNTVAGTYTVLATDSSTGCSGNMASSASITVNPAPDVDNVSGGGSFCAGGSGAPVNLDESDAGINYQLYNGSIAVGPVVPGSGTSLSFGMVTGAGAYKVIAVNVVTGCSDTMSGSAVVIVKPLPTAFAVTAENYGNYCAGDSGVHVSLAGSNSEVTYKLYRGGTTTPALATVTGTGLPIDFGLEVVAGNYMVTASDPATTCNNTMAGSANVYIIPLPIVHNVIGGGGYCPGGAGVDIALDGSQAGIYYQLYNSGAPVGGPIYGTGAELDFGILPAGNYTIVGNSEVIAMGYVTTCPNPMFGTATVSVDSLLLPSVTLVAYPGSGVGVWHIDSMKVFVTNGGSNPTFQWVINGNIISGATSATFTNHEFFNKDSVACMVTASGPCGGLSTSKSITLSLHNVGVTQVTSAGSDIKLVPNPNKGAFTVKGTLGTTSDEEVSMDVTNMLGQVVYTGKVVTHGGDLDAHIDLGNSLANGMYIMTVRSGTQNNVIHFVIEQ